MTRDSMVPIPQPLSAPKKGWQSLPLGALALLAGPIGLMVTETTKVNKNKNWIAERC